jgi:DNA-binding MarR family transcriptional regulator
MTLRATPIDAKSIASLDKTMHEPARLSVVACLYVVDEADFVFLQSQTGITGGNLSSHLKRLAGDGHITIRKEFDGVKPRTTLSLTRSGRKTFVSYIKTLGQLLEVMLAQIR